MNTPSRTEQVRASANAAAPIFACRAVALPEAFLEWQTETRRQLFHRLLQGETVRFLGSHLPVVASRTPDGGINLANKGVGLVPMEERVETYTRLYRDVFAAVQGRPWAETLPERVDAAQHLLRHPEDVDAARLGSLEIFEGESYRNIRNDARVSLLYTGEGPRYPSFQIDAEAEILEPGEALYEFLVASRKLFEHDHFHIAQPGYPHAYVFTVQGVREKTPKTRQCPVAHGRPGRQEEAS